MSKPSRGIAGMLYQFAKQNLCRLKKEGITPKLVSSWERSRETRHHGDADGFVVSRWLSPQNPV